MCLIDTFYEIVILSEAKDLLFAAKGRCFGLREITNIKMPSASPNSRIKPRALRPGDKVGIVAPASNLKREMLEAGCDGLRRAGYEPFYFESILERELYFAGSVERRARELEDMFARDDIRAIVCARGGYGSNYLLPASGSKTLGLK